MVQQTNTFLSFTGDDPVDGDWMQVPQSGRTHVPVSISITVSTATVVIEGRNSADDAAVQLASVTASDALLVQRMSQMRARATAVGTDTVVRVTGDLPMKTVE